MSSRDNVIYTYQEGSLTAPPMLSGVVLKYYCHGKLKGIRLNQMKGLIMTPKQSAARDLQTANDGDEVKRHDLTLYFMKFQAELEAFKDDMDQTSNETEERLVVQNHWERIFGGKDSF